MPAGFDNCERRGGRIRTIKLSGSKYRHICYINGKFYLGHIKTKKKTGTKK